MRYIISILFFICACSINVCMGQQGVQQDVGQDKLRLVIVPREIALPVVVHQPDCPLQFENIVSVVSVDGGGSPSYEVRNQSSRPIRAYQTVVLTSASTGSWGLSFEAKTPKEWLLPGQVAPRLPPSQNEVVPLTAELREKLRLRGPMKGILIFMIVRVEFADGSVYDDEKAYKALQAYLEDIDTKLNP